LRSLSSGLYLCSLRAVAVSGRALSRSVACRFPLPCPSFFFSDASATTEIYTLSLHDALPISRWRWAAGATDRRGRGPARRSRTEIGKSTRLNSSHVKISYAVFCLKKKKKTRTPLAGRKRQRQAGSTTTHYQAQRAALQPRKRR